MNRSASIREEMERLQAELEERDNRIVVLERVLAAKGANVPKDLPGMRAGALDRARVSDAVNLRGYGASMPPDVKEQLATTQELLRQHTREKKLTTPPSEADIPHSRPAFGIPALLLAALAGALFGGAGLWVAGIRPSSGSSTALARNPGTPSGQPLPATGPQRTALRENASVHTGLPDPVLTPGETDAALNPEEPVSLETYRLVCERYGVDPGNPLYGVARRTPAWMHGSNRPPNLFATTRVLANLKIQYDRKLKEMLASHEIMQVQVEHEVDTNWLESWARRMRPLPVVPQLLLGTKGQSPPQHRDPTQSLQPNARADNQSAKTR